MIKLPARESIQCQLVLAVGALVAPLAGADPVHFSYSGDTGPDNWSKLSPNFAMCQSGKHQSPIDISTAQDVDLPELDIDYSTAAINFVNNGHAVQSNFGAGNTLANDYHENAPYRAHVTYSAGSSINHLDSAYELKQFHFHSPSEHTLNGEHMPAEIHFVHGDENGHLAVVAVFARIGPANPEIAKLWQSLPDEEGESNSLGQQIRASELLPTSKSYYFYQGSLTTPPCTEGVRWLVMQEPITMSAEQIDALQKAIGFDNCRPTQALNGRVVMD
jgi:carbonic anhydrase